MKRFYKIITSLSLVLALSLSVFSFNNVEAITDAEVESVAKHVKRFNYKYANFDYDTTFTFNKKKHTGKLKIKAKVRAVKGYRFRVRKVTSKYKLKNNKEVLVSKKTTYHIANKSKDTKFKFKIKYNKNETTLYWEKGDFAMDKKNNFIGKNNKYKVTYKKKNYYFKYRKEVGLRLQVKVNGIWQEIM